MLELFGYYLQRGLIDVGFLGAAQIDRFGNINTTVIGDYDAPDDAAARLGRRVRDRDQRPAGVRDHAPVARASFVERIDFRTSPGNLGGAEHADAHPARAGLARAAARPWWSRTSGIYHFDETARCASTRSTRARPSRPSATRSAGRSAVAADLAATPAPSDEELRLIREELDPAGDYTK